MAKKQILTVQDTAAKLYGQPFFVPSVAAGLRSVGDEANRSASDNALYQHPDDFVVYHLGVFDDETGRFETMAPVQVARVKDLIQKI